jgi:putative glutamine amidotransferase
VTRPAIGITIGCDDRQATHYALRRDYVRAVERAGGLPLVLAPGAPRDVADVLARIDGLLLSGGSDVDPSLYGEEPHADLGPVVHERDLFELALCREALERNMPLLAICRGQQVLNVATGGTLIQHIPSQVMGAQEHTGAQARERWELAHDVEILPETRLRAILGADKVAVNSFHHQAIKDLGRGLVVSAVSVDDHVIEGAEAADRRFAVGVQWHPESFWGRDSGFQPLFEALVQAAGIR